MAKSLMDAEILQAALIGLEQQKAEIDGKMTELRRKLRSKFSGATALTSTVPVARKRRRLSAAARKRIGEATRKRWAEYRKAKGK